MSFKELLNQTPDMVVSPNVVVTADVKFHKLLRVEGIVEGKVIAPQEACLVLCPGGQFKGHLKGLGPQAVVTGNITCQQIEVSASAKILGNLNISPTLQISNDVNEENMKELIIDQT